MEPVTANQYQQDSQLIANLQYNNQEAEVVYSSLSEGPSAPPSVEYVYTYYNNNGGHVHANEDYDECTSTPSMSPSISSIPTTSPSDVPSRFPTDIPSEEPSRFPTDIPSEKPSISLSPTDEPSEPPSALPSNLPSDSPSREPSVSHLPSTSLQPSSNPSSSPSTLPSNMPSTNPSLSTNPSISANPSAVHSTNPSDMPSNNPSMSMIPTETTSATRIGTRNIAGSFKFDMETVPEDTDIDSAGFIMSQAEEIVEDVLDNIIYKVSNAISVIPQTRHLQNDASEPQVTDGCEQLIFALSNNCHTITGEYSYNLPTNDFSDEQLRTHTLLIIKEKMATYNMNDDNYRAFFLGGLIGGLFIPTEQIFSRAESQALQNSSTSNLTVAGIGMVTAASVLLMAFIFVVARKKRHHDIHIKEGILDDDLLFGKSSRNIGLRSYSGYSDYDTDHMSIASSNRRQHAAHVIGEDDSVFSSNSFEQDGRLYGLGRSPQSIIDIEEDNQAWRNGHDVHKCTSTTCPICCKEQGPTFVASDGLEPVQEDDLLQLDKMEQRSFVAPDTIDM